LWGKALGPGPNLMDSLKDLRYEADFDHWVEEQCQPFFKTRGRTSISQGV